MKKVIAISLMVVLLCGCEKPIKTIMIKISYERQLGTNPTDIIVKEQKIIEYGVLEESEHYYQIFRREALPKNPSKRLFGGPTDDGLFSYYSLWEDGERVKGGKLVDKL